MFEKIGRLAEQAATKVSVSRRGFLGRLGQGALATIGVLGGAFVFSQDAGAGGSGGVYCCEYLCRNSSYGYPGGNGKNRYTTFACYSGGCPSMLGSLCHLQRHRQVSDCTQC